MAKKLHRRTVLKGLAGAAVSLPLLECMLDSKQSYAQGYPARYALLFAGQAVGADGWAKNSSRVNGQNITEGGHFVADTSTGRGYSLTTPLLPLAALRDDFSMVSNMSIPFNRNSTDGNAVPQGGAYRDFHGGCCSPQLSGTRSTNAGHYCNGITSDQVIANLNAGQTLHDSLVLQAQPTVYRGGFGGRQHLSYSAAESAIQGYTNLGAAFDGMFRGFMPGDPEEAARFDFEMRARRSVLDLVLEKRQRLMSTVGRADQTRLERHFDEIRELESKITSTPPGGGAGCGVLPVPGEPNHPDPGYSNEHGRARAMADLIHMAFVCDLTRASTLLISAFQSFMNVKPISDGIGSLQGTTRPSQWGSINTDLHEYGHNGDSSMRGIIGSAGLLQWHISHYAYLINKLKSTPEGGGSVLDNSVIVFAAEGGHGTSLNDLASNSSHSVENMVMLVAGRAGGLNPGQHIDAGGRHPAQCLVSAMQAAGYTGNTLGQVAGNISELFG